MTIFEALEKASELRAQADELQRQASELEREHLGLATGELVSAHKLVEAIVKVSQEVASRPRAVRLG